MLIPVLQLGSLAETVRHLQRFPVLTYVDLHQQRPEVGEIMQISEIVTYHD
jgi:hypothetical protein